MPTKNNHSHSSPPWFWFGFFGVLGLLVLLTLFAVIRSTMQLAETGIQQTDSLPPSVTAVIQVTLSGGESVYIDPSSVERIRAQTHDWVAAHRGAQIPAEILENIYRDTDAILAAANEQVPAFADWYYSLSGEYARIFYALADKLPEYIEDKLNELVLEPAGTDEAIITMGNSLNYWLQNDIFAIVVNLENLLTRLVHEASVETTDLTIEVNAEWALNQQLAEQFTTYVAPGPQDIVRQGMAVSAGIGLSAAAAKKIAATSAAKLSAKIAATEASKLLAVSTSKLGAKVLSSAGTGATTGATICMSSGIGAPLAPGCALIVGAGVGLGTWVLVDKAVIETEDWLHRETFEKELRQSLTDWRDGLRTEFRANYELALNAAMDQLLASVDNKLLPAPSGIGRGFVPAEAAKPSMSRNKLTPAQKP